MTRVLHLGDLDIALPLAAALAAWLLAARAWRAALYWILGFGSAVALVGATKVAFLAWGTGLDAVGFKAISGHATTVTALYPAAAYVLLRRQGRTAAWTGLLGGLALGGFVAALLVASAEHSIAEAAAGWALGAGVGLGTVLLSAQREATPPLPALWWSLPVFAVAAWLLESAPVGWWMIRLALVLSGSDRPHAWDSCG